MVESTNTHMTEFVIDKAEIKGLLRQENPTASPKVIDAVIKAMVGAGEAVADAMRQMSSPRQPSTGKQARARRERTVSVQTEPEALEGEGLGLLLASPEAGMAVLRDVAVKVPLEDWAGDLATPTALHSRLGIARSTLSAWREKRDVVALPKGKRGHVYPLAQFKDGRPLSGIREILSLTSGNALVAWRWLLTPHEDFGMTPPLEALRDGDVSSVLDAARRSFG